MDSPRQLFEQLHAERQRRLAEKLGYEEQSPRQLLASFDTVRSPSRQESDPLSGLERQTEEASYSLPSRRYVEDSLLIFDSHRRSLSSRSFRERLDVSTQQSRYKLDLRKQQQEQELARQCTFKPLINGKSQSFARRSRGCVAEALGERLGPSEERRRCALRDQAKELMQADDLYECTFTPRINSRSVDGRVPLHIRTNTIQQCKEERLRAIREAKMKQLHPFRPQISAKSQRMARRRARSQDAVHQRLSAVKRDPAESLQRTLENPGKTDPVARTSAQAFLARQDSFEKERSFRKSVREQLASAEWSFRPKISESSEDIAACNLELLCGCAEDRLERLAVADVLRRRKRQQHHEEALARECTFRPSLSPQSQAIAATRSTSPVHQRLYEEARARKEASPEREAQWQPEHSKRFAHVKPHYATPAQIMESIRKQQDRRAEKLLAHQEQRALVEKLKCTFRPELCHLPSADRPPVVVCGLDRFYELKGLAEQRDVEQKAHEAKVFRHGCTHGPPMGITIPEPFALSVSNSSKDTR